MASRVAANSPSSRWLAGVGTAASGMPSASTATERLRPCLRRSTGLGPAVWPPQGALVVQRGDLDPEGFQDRRWQGRHETSR
jgi:hypothetical protein